MRRADPLQEVDVALVLSGKTPCALCGKPVTTGDDLVSFPAFLPSSHELGLFSDAPFHRACFEGDPRAERVNALHGRYRAIWDARPRELRTLAEIDAWGREAFKDFP